MNKSLVLLMILFILVPSSVFASAADIKFSGYAWLRETGTTAQYSDKRLDSSKASIERLYLKWKLKYENSLEGNLTLDVPMKSGNTANSDWTALVKFAYVDVKDLLPANGLLRLGVQPLYFAMLDKWEYQMTYKPLEDQVGLLSSSDLGASMQWLLPEGWGDYQMAVYGGNGFAKPSETENNAATDMSLNITPLPGFSIRGSIYNSVVSTIDASKSDEGEQTGKWYNAAAVNYYVGPLWFMWEGVEGMKPNTLMTDSFKISGNSKLVMWDVNDQWTLGIREDIFNPDVNNEIGSNDTKDSAQDRMIYAVNYKWAKDLLVQLNYSKLTYDGGNQAFATGARDTEYQTVLQLKWSY